MLTASEAKLIELTQRVEDALAEIRSLATSPVEISYGDKANILVQPLSSGDRLDVCCSDWGHTTVNYSVEGLIVDVYNGEAGGYELVHTAAIPREDLMGDIDPGVADALQSTKTVTVIVSAHCVSDLGEGPTAAAITVNAAFIKRMLQMQRKCDSSITQVVVTDGPALWYPKGVEEDLRLNMAQMIFVEDGFWFSDRPKHADYDIESAQLSTEAILRLFNDAADGQTVVVGEGDFQDYVAALVDEPELEESTHG